MTGLGKMLKRGFYPGIVTATFSFIATVLSAWLILNGLAPEKLVPVSQMIVQLDSFLTAAAMVAFSFFWGSIVREYRGFRSMLNEFKDKLTGNTKALEDLQFLQQKAQLGGSFLLFGVGGIVGFALSAFLAVASAITGIPIVLIVALFSLAVGIGTMLQSWFEFNRSSEAVFDITENAKKILARATSGPTSDSPSQQP